MGLVMTKLARLLEGSGTISSRIVMLGLDAAGKTTILYKFKMNKAITAIPTMGFNAEKVKVKNVKFIVRDVGGQAKVRNLWHHFFADSDALIFVVDTSDRERLKEAGEELHGVLNDDLMRDVPLVVFANKRDLANAVSTDELVIGLGLRNLSGNEWHIQATNAITGEGLFEGLETVAKLCSRRKTSCAMMTETRFQFIQWRPQAGLQKRATPGGKMYYDMQSM